MLVLALALGGGLAPARHVVAQQQPGIRLYNLGSQKVSGRTWSFSGDFPIGAGAWESLTVSNYGYCFVGPNDPRAGTAHAAAVFWFTELSPDESGDDQSFTGTLASDRSMATGDATVTTTDDGSGPMTHVEMTISGNDLRFYQDNTLTACLLGSS
jgi:hypothetical protein